MIHEFYTWYFSIQLCNVGTIIMALYWVVGRHPDGGIAGMLAWGKLCSIYNSPLCWRGNKHAEGVRAKQDWLAKETREGFRWTSPQKIKKNLTWTRSVWFLVGAEINRPSFPFIDPAIREFADDAKFRSIQIQPNSCVFGSVINTRVGSWMKFRLPWFDEFPRNASFRHGMNPLCSNTCTW